jgi:hypothetical protein
VTGVDEGSLAVQPHGGEATLPDPAGADIWAAAATGSGSAALVWPDAPGSWRMVAAGDGTVPPSRVTLSWTRAPQPSGAPLLLGLGAGLLVAAAALLVARRLFPRRLRARRLPPRRRQDSPDADQAPPDDPPLEHVHATEASR